jgi:hypothetical protein
MKYNIGDEVVFLRENAFISNHACEAHGIDFINSIIFRNCKFYKGKITKIKTHSWLFFKLKKPLYMIDDYYFTSDVKPIIKLKALI